LPDASDSAAGGSGGGGSSGSGSRLSLSDLTPAVLVGGTAVPVPGSDLQATLVDYRFSRGRDEQGNEKLIAWAEIRLAGADGDEESVRWDFYTTNEAFESRLYLAGSRSEVLLYALPNQ
jgi:hypothetical protein